MIVRSKPQAKARSGPIVLGGELGRGGEGAVYEVAGRPDVVAKIYHLPIGGEKAEKIEAMASMKNDHLLAVTSWPIEPLTTLGGAACGFLMPRVRGHKDIHNLYSPRSRRTEFPNADWRFLIRSAANTARAFAIVHETGAVIGDVNHGGVAVSEKATVKLIDCDSFQIAARGKRFLCEVGVPPFTPSELQGKSFRGVLRTPNHDNFGLAVLAFHLLFMGRHPFAGRYLGRGDMGLEQAISECRFAYGHNRAAVQMEPPPAVPPLDVASSPIALLFERAFSPQGGGGQRPTAREWVAALDILGGQTKQCSSNASHHYLTSLGECPWCGVEAAAGVILFGHYIQRTAQNSGKQFDLSAVWTAIMAVPSPGPAPQGLSRSKASSFQPSAEARSAGGRIPKAVRIGGVLAAAAILVAAVPQASIVWAIGAILLLATGAGGKADQQAVANFTTKLRSAEAQHRALANRWEIDGSDARLTSLLRDLSKKRGEWKDLPQVRQRRLAGLEQSRRTAQLQRFLERYQTEDASIAGIGPSRKVMLASYNVETAWDVTTENIKRVPGFGPALTDKLMEWRRQVEQRFEFDQSQGVDPRDIASLDRELADARRNLETSLMNGPAELKRLHYEIITHRTAVRPQLDAALRQVLQAEADLKSVRG